MHYLALAKANSLHGHGFHRSETRSDALIGNSYDLDTFQLTSVIGTQGVLYRPTISDIVRVRKGQ